MKKNLLLTFSLLGLAGGLASCSCENKEPVPLKPNVPEIKEALVSFNTMYTNSAITGISMLNADINTGAATLALTDEEKDKVIENYELLEGIISDDVIQSETKPSDKPEYKEMYDIIISNLDGTKDKFTFYYNELDNATPEAPKVLDNNDDENENEDKKDNNDEIEQEIHLEGIVLKNDKEYAMTGSKEIEKSADELEIKLKYEISDPETNEKIIIIQENESETEDGQSENEQEFSIKRFDAEGKETYKKKVSIETDEVGELEYSVKETINGVNSKIKFEIVTDKNKEKVVEAEITEADKIIKTNFQIALNEDGTISYVFEE